MQRAFMAILGLIVSALLTTLYLRARLIRSPGAGGSARVFTVHRGDVVVKVAETGTVEPLTRVEVKSKVGGKVLRLVPAEGDRVYTGQVLAVLDPIEQQSQVGQIRAQVAAARAHLAEAVCEAQSERRTVQLGIAEAEEQLRADGDELNARHLQTTADIRIEREPENRALPQSSPGGAPVRADWIAAIAMAVTAITMCVRAIILIRAGDSMGIVLLSFGGIGKGTIDMLHHVGADNGISKKLKRIVRIVHRCFRATRMVRHGSQQQRTVTKGYLQ